MAGKPEIARQNGKKGGRPKGKQSKKTIERNLERKAVNDAFNQKTLKAANRLWQAQAGLAIGSTYLYKIEKEWVKTGTNRKTGADNGFWRKLKPELVTSQLEIESYLMGLVEEGDPEDENDPGATYYFFTTKDPDNRALDSMVDRAMGKTPNATKLVDDEGKSIPITSIQVVPLDPQK